jgi:hypothetical protein
VRARDISTLLIALLVFCAAIQAQTPAGSPVPGPATPRPQPQGAPPRDGAATPTGTGRIRGRVVSAETGNPLRRSQVRLSGAANGMPVGQTASTDADGRYEFTKLPASRYTLSVSRSGYVTLQFGQRRPFEPGKPLALAEGEVADRIDFALPRGGVIVGTITDETGEPMPGVRMQAERYQYMPGGQRRLVGGMMGMFGPVVTDDLGQFRVYGLTPGSYVLSAVAQPSGMMVMTTAGAVSAAFSGQGGNDGFATTYFPGTASADEAQTIAVDLGQEASAHFSLVSARMSRISGTIRNSQGNPLAGRVMLSLRTAFGNGGYTNNGMSSVSLDGSFNIANVPPGEHFIDVRPMPTGPPVAGAAAQGVEEEFASVPVTVSGQDIVGMVITTGPGATVSGRLVFDGDSPRPQVAQQLRVGVSPADPSSQSFMMMMPTQDNGVIDEAGRFLLRGVNGQVLFRTGAQGWNLKSVTLNGVDITDTPFEAKPSTNINGLEITLTDRQTSLSGTVKKSNGDAVKDFVVVIFPSGLRDGTVPTRFTRTSRPDQQGGYQIRGLPPGDYVAAAVESLEQGGEWDPAFQQHVKPRGKTFRLSDAQMMTLDLSLVQ